MIAYTCIHLEDIIMDFAEISKNPKVDIWLKSKI